MHWFAVILVAIAAGFIQFWHLCRTAPVMLEDDLEIEPTELMREYPTQVDKPVSANVDTPRNVEGPASRGSTALDMVGRPAPELVWPPVDMRSRLEADHQQKERVGCDGQE